MGIFVAVAAILHFWIVFKVLEMKINEIVNVHWYTVNQIAGIPGSSSSSSSINLQATSGVLSQNNYLHMPNGNIFPTNYVQMLKAIVVVYTIKTGMSNTWQHYCLEAVFESFQGGWSYDRSW